MHEGAATSDSVETIELDEPASWPDAPDELPVIWEVDDWPGPFGGATRGVP
jgi:hypothetical protein